MLVSPMMNSLWTQALTNSWSQGYPVLATESVEDTPAVSWEQLRATAPVPVRVSRPRPPH